MWAMKPVPRAVVANLRQSLKLVGMVVAEVDGDLRYRWIENPHPDFDPASVVSKRDDELVGADEAEGIASLKRMAFSSGVPVSKTLAFRRSDGLRHYTLFAYPIIETTGTTQAILTVAVPVPVPGGK